MITEPIIGEYLTLYAIILSLCAAGGLYLSTWLYREEKTLLLDAGLGILLFSLLSARIGFVLRNFSYFISNPLDIPQIWLGGLSWPGALIGAVIALVVIRLIWKEPPGEVADQLLPLFGLVVVGIWLTSWGGGIGYGPLTDGWYGLPVRDQLGLLSRRWPLPILGAIFSGLWVTGAILFPLKKTHRPGTRALLGVAGVAGINLVISFFKVDPAPYFLGLRWESWFSILFLITSAGLTLILKDDQKL